MARSKGKGRKKDVPSLKSVVGVAKRTATLPENTNGDRVAWRFGRLDIDGAWSPLFLEEPHLREVLDKLTHAEGRTWGELMKGKTLKPIALDHICAAARKRLDELKADDFDTLVEYHLKGKWRVWGVRVGGAFELLWWDPDHEVCPSKKKHT